MAELLVCKVCSGKVASDARVCPHCGSPNFKPDSFIENERKRHDTLINQSQVDYENRFGPVIYVSIHANSLPKSNSMMRGLSISAFSIDGKPLDKEEIGYYHYRLKPGNHTVTLRFQYQKFVKETSLTFNTASDTKEVALFYSFVKAGFFTPAHYVLDNVEVLNYRKQW